jgi:uncharacterized protein (DUF488 family)
MDPIDPDQQAMNLFTIGFTKKTAEQFFTRLKQSGARRVLDVRLHNSSQLAGFAKQADLAFFLKEICGMDYIHLPELAPTGDMLDAFKKQKGDWKAYEGIFTGLLRERQVEKTLSRELLADGCLLCSEDKPHHCHRRLIAEYLDDKWGGMTIRHL